MRWAGGHVVDDQIIIIHVPVRQFIQVGTSMFARRVPFLQQTMRQADAFPTRPISAVVVGYCHESWTFKKDVGLRLAAKLVEAFFFWSSKYTMTFFFS